MAGEVGKRWQGKSVAREVGNRRRGGRITVGSDGGEGNEGSARVKIGRGLIVGCARVKRERIEQIHTVLSTPYLGQRE